MESQEQARNSPSDPSAADESETRVPSVWSSYAQAHLVMIADPATLEVLQGVPVPHKVDEPPAEPQDSQGWAEAEAVLVAATAAEGVAETADGGLEEAAAEGELQMPEPAGSCLADFAAGVSGLSGGNVGACDWLSVLANSFARNASNG